MTIRASPSSAILGDTITFTGRVLLDGTPASVGITIFLDTAPAPPTTLASGDTDSNGNYSITWTSNFTGSLPIFALAAAFQGFTSPTIIVPIIGSGVEVHLEPRLHNALLEFRFRSFGLDEFLYSQLSVLGRTAWPQGSFTVFDIFQVRFPPQTVGGVAYLEARTPTFMYQTAPHIFTLFLQGADVTTSITISAPSSVLEATPFTVSGRLTRADTGEGMANQPVMLDLDGVILAGANTDTSGNYAFDTVIDAPGIYTLTVTFSGLTLALSAQASLMVQIA